MRYLVKRIPSTSLVQYDGSRYYCEIAGGTAEKATVDTTGLLAGSKYLDVQTGTWYVYDELSNAWAVSAEGGSADPAVVEAAVEAWLDAHPEATTTVQDGSISYAKLDTTLKGKADAVATLSDEIDDLWNVMSFDMTLPTIMANLRHNRIDKIPLGATFTVPHAVYGDITFAIRAKNMHKCADDETKPTLTIQPIYLLSNNGGSSAATFQFDRAEAFCKVETLIPAGTVCKFTTITYGGWIAGTYMFTADSDIPVGSKLCISGAQNTALTSLKVRVYASAKATAHSAEYAISTEDGTATLDLGTLGEDLNHPQRVSYGSNNEAQSNIFQWLNADTGNANMDSVYEESTEFDMMDTSFTSKKGFLGGFGAEFRSYLGLAKIPNITNSVYETDPYIKNEAYTHQGYFFLPSRKEIFGSNENSYEADESQFDFYKNIMTADADKLMFARGATSPASYWLRTPYSGYAISVRICYTGSGGALYSNNAHNSFAVAPLAILA